MDKDLQYKIQDLQIRLNSYDMYAKGSVCDEFLDLIKGSENVDLKAELCRMVVLCLVDLDRDSDVATAAGKSVQRDSKRFSQNLDGGLRG